MNRRFWGLTPRNLEQAMAMELIADDPTFAAIKDRLPDLMQPSRFVGRCAEQVDAFVAKEVAPRLQGVDLEGMAGELRV